MTSHAEHAEHAVSLSSNASTVDVAELKRSLCEGRPVSDSAFDDVYPIDARWRSSVYWTPVGVAMRAAALLADKPRPRILDIGAGIGKFCLVAAASTGARALGIEQRPHLVEIARAAAKRIGVDATFEHRTSFDDLEASEIDGIYVFNPFAENLCEAADLIDTTVELSEERYWNDIAATERLLWRAPLGTRFVVYCGFGGDVPDGYTLESREHPAGTLELWVKNRPSMRALRRVPRVRSPNAPW